jgi:hypothetical protein
MIIIHILWRGALVCAAVYHFVNARSDQYDRMTFAVALCILANV